jgi:type VI secretion system secreted protein VgrG
MEREGLYYFFEHEGDRERLVITDSKSIHERLRGPVRYHPIAGRDITAGDRLESFRCQHLSLPAQVRVQDYDYLKPTLDVSGAAPVSRTGFGEISIHGARVFTPEQSKRLAKIRAEELLARKVVIQAAGSAPRLRAGYVFELDEHPRPSFNAAYLATEVTHSGNHAASTDELKRLIALEHDEVYRVEVTAIPADVQFRAVTMTSWPRVYGTENGVVCGPTESEYAQIDEHGRYAVKFKFDESDRKQGRASTYVRMLQPHGGGVEGFHFPLRKGTEVLLTFLGGDPDRPVIAGTVPNLHTPSPVTAGNNTKNVIQTGGRNRIEMEDRAGQQRITLSTPHANTYLRMGAPNDQHELIVHTDQNALLDAKQNWDVVVGAHLDERVTGTVYEEYHDTKTERVTGVYDVYYHADVKSFINATTNETFNGARETYSWGTVKEEVGGNCEQTFHSPVKRTIYGKLEENVSATSTQTVGGDISITSTGGKITIRSPTEITIAASKVSIKSDHQWFKTPGSSLELYGSKNSLGVQKFDHAGINLATNSFKMERTQAALSLTDIKIEKTGMSVARTELKLETMAARFQDCPVNIEDKAITVQKGAFASITKGFLKIG